MVMYIIYFFQFFHSLILEVTGGGGGHSVYHFGNVSRANYSVQKKIILETSISFLKTYLQIPHTYRFDEKKILSFSSKYGDPQNLLFFFYFCVKILMRFTEYIYLPSFNSIGLIVSEKSGCDIRTDRQTDRHDESIRVPFFAIWLVPVIVAELTFIDRRGLHPILSGTSDGVRFGAMLTRLNQLELVRTDEQYGGRQIQVHLLANVFTVAGSMLNLQFIYTYVHKLTPFSHEGRQKPQHATCYDPYILLSPRPGSYIWSFEVNFVLGNVI